MAFLEQWLIPLLIVAAILYAIYQNWPSPERQARRKQTGRQAKGQQGRATVAKAGARAKEKASRGPSPAAFGGGFAAGLPGRGRELEWVPIQSAIGSERALLPTAQLLRRNGVEARIVRVTMVPGRRLMRLAVRHADLRRAREILSREDLYVKARLHS